MERCVLRKSCTQKVVINNPFESAFLISNLGILLYQLCFLKPHLLSIRKNLPQVKYSNNSIIINFSEIFNEFLVKIY